MQRTALTDDDIKAEVSALEQQGHRRLLVLTGEHPKYTFDQFLHVSRSIDACAWQQQIIQAGLFRSVVYVPAAATSVLERATDAVGARSQLAMTDT